MGTPDFAVEALQCLVEGGYNVVGVITMPDKPAGRGHKIQYSPVKQYALDHQLPLLQPEKLKDEEFIQALREWKADLQIVVAFRMLPEVVLEGLRAHLRRERFRFIGKLRQRVFHSLSVFTV